MPVAVVLLVCQNSFVGVELPNLSAVAGVVASNTVERGNVPQRWENAACTLRRRSLRSLAPTISFTSFSLGIFVEYTMNILEYRSSVRLALLDPG